MPGTCDLHGDGNEPHTLIHLNEFSVKGNGGGVVDLFNISFPRGTFLKRLWSLKQIKITFFRKMVFPLYSVPMLRMFIILNVDSVNYMNGTALK